MNDEVDAARFRKLCALFQSAYDTDVFESDSIDVYCQLHSQFRGTRTIQAELRWGTTDDDRLGLGAALDAIPDGDTP